MKVCSIFKSISIYINKLFHIQINKHPSTNSSNPLWNVHRIIINFVHNTFYFYNCPYKLFKNTLYGRKSNSSSHTSTLDINEKKELTTKKFKKILLGHFNKYMEGNTYSLPSSKGHHHLYPSSFKINGNYVEDGGKKIKTKKRMLSSEKDNKKGFLKWRCESLGFEITRLVHSINQPKSVQK